jgi:hypothetical protein
VTLPQWLLVPADVDRQKPGYVGKLVLGGSFDEGVNECLKTGVQVCPKMCPGQMVSGLDEAA